MIAPFILRTTVVYGNGSNSNKCDYDYKVDIWSFGVIAYYKLMGVIPFNGVVKDALSFWMGCYMLIEMLDQVQRSC